MKKDYEIEIRKIETEPQKSTNRDTNFDGQVKFCISLLAQLPEYYDSADLAAKQQIIGAIFLENLVFENKSFRTKRVNEAVELICRTDKSFNRSQNEKSSENS